MGTPPPRIDAGIYNVARPSYSASTMQLMKVLMEETKVPHAQQKLFQQSLRSGKPLPQIHRPTQVGRRQRNSARQQEKTDENCGKRSRYTIKMLDDGKPSVYKPTPGRDREAERERLAHVMTHGRDARPDLGGPAPSDTSPETPREQSRFDELWREVEERRSFLEEMKKMGRAKDYEPIIRSEVARLVKEMEQLHQEENEKANNS